MEKKVTFAELQRAKADLNWHVKGFSNLLTRLVNRFEALQSKNIYLSKTSSNYKIFISK